MINLFYFINLFFSKIAGGASCGLRSDDEGSDEMGSGCPGDQSRECCYGDMRSCLHLLRSITRLRLLVYTTKKVLASTLG